MNQALRRDFMKFWPMNWIWLVESRWSWSREVNGKNIGSRKGSAKHSVFGTQVNLIM